MINIQRNAMYTDIHIGKVAASDVDKKVEGMEH